VTSKIQIQTIAHEPDLPLADRVREKLLEETQLAIEAGDLPIGCVLTVGDMLLASNRNRIGSQKDRRFHAERNLLAQLAQTDLPAGRRVLWVTLEPCLRCAQAIQRFGVDEVVYVLDDPFGGGKALLAEAGITLTQRGDWEYATLQRVMDSFVRYPELCDGRQFPFFLTAWQRYKALGRDEQVRAVFLHHLAPYLNTALASVPEMRHNEIRRLYLAHVDVLTRLTLGEFAAIPSPVFVRNLHRALYPPNYRHRAVGNDGVASETASGEWRKHVLWPHYTEFSAPEAVETDLTGLLSNLSAKALLQREDALRFVFDFTAIHPFTDGNGRLAALLADMICLNHGLAPLALDRKNGLFHTALMENLAHGAPISEQLNLVDAWNRGAVGIRPRSIYDDRPSAFQTYTRRTDQKHHVVTQVLAKLSEQRLNQHLVVTDIGAGTGIIANGIVHGLLQREGMAFEYHYVEPAPASIEYFRKHSRYASLPQVVFHTLPSEDFLLPPSDLIMLVQTVQHLTNPAETLRDIVAALQPGGLALIVCNHPDSDEWRMMNRLTHGSTTYEHLKELLDKERVGYEEMVVESSVRLGTADRDTPEGDDLLTFYFNSPLAVLPSAMKAAFWAGLADFARDGVLRKKEAFFWLRGRNADGDSMNASLSSASEPPQKNVLPAVVPAMPLSFGKAVETSLLPRLLHTLEKRPAHEHERLIDDFRSHVRLLSDYLRGEIIDGTLSINSAIGLHVRLYPPGYLIDAMDNQGSPGKPGNPVKISPGAWRQRDVRDEPFRSDRWYSVCSPLACVERDLEQTISALNKIQNPRREDILRFYFSFLKVHPFADSNGTTSAVLSDALCAHHDLAPLLPLNIRFKDKAFAWSLCKAFDRVKSEQSLTDLLMQFDAFNRAFPAGRLSSAA
jgi:tRNA(Arg) A34 adenosine deaminase TadA/SAM-dependent methyltransferase/Fic family protein